MLIVQVEHEPRQLLVGGALMLVTAVIQTFGVVTLEELVERIHETSAPNMTRARMLTVLCSVVVYLFALHLFEMSVWAAVMRPLAGYSSFAVSLYESALAFTTMDVAEMPPAWKFLSAAEGVTGLLMFAWSTSVLFNQTSWITEARRKYLRRHHLYGMREPAAPPPN
ncbi:MAG TPA: hypothetical protein VMN82_02225 [Thermoanaerobaculia bacterium]|nr:hypothetical protein [Thermoanaerobaculia bacterium]